MSAAPSLRELALRALADKEAAKAKAARSVQEEAMLAAAAFEPDAPPEVLAYAGSIATPYDLSYGE